MKQENEMKKMDEKEGEEWGYEKAKRQEELKYQLFQQMGWVKIKFGEYRKIKAG